MKKFLGVLGVCLFMAGGAFGWPQSTETVAKTVVIDQVAVSSTTAEVVYSQAADLAGRTQICFEGIDATYGVWIATHSGVTATNGWYIGDKDNPNSSICFPFGSNYTFYGLAETGQDDSNLAIIEIRQ